jgi:hypothetical protein
VSGLIDVQLNAHAVAETVRFVVAWRSLDYRAKLDAGHALERLLEYVCLEFTLTSEANVAKLSATGTADTGLFPEVTNAVVGCLEDFDWLCATESTAAVFVHASAHLFTRQHVGNEDDSTLVAGNEDATVRHLLDGQCNFAA